ncbi:MAG: redoxin domain-containing protein [Eubacteriales bacterium]|nr:redoxin domain-containing protein [Eubacteriales bacterium]
MRLIEGQKSKAFSTSDILENEIILENFKGKKILLSFYRYASCPLCNLRVSELIGQDTYFKEKGLVLLAIFQSPKDRILEYVGKQNTPFPIIADPEQRLYKLYGVEVSGLGLIRALFKPGKFKEALNKGFHTGTMEGPKTRIPADFIIGENGIILKAYYGKDIGDHMPIEMIEEVLDKVK